MNLPALTRPVLLLLFILLLIGFLYVGRPFLVPAGYGMLLSIALTPLCRKLEKWGAPRGLAVVVCVVLLFSLVVGMIWVLSLRMVDLAQDFVQLQDQVLQRLDRVKDYVTHLTGWSQERQVTYLKSKTSALLETASTYLQSLLTSAALTMVEFGVILFYVFCMMYYRDHFERFILDIVPRGEQKTAKTLEMAIGEMTYQYISGRLLVLLIQGIIYYLGFLLVGAPYPLFFAVLGALFNIVPYIGAVLAGLFPLMIAMLASRFFTIIGIAGVALGNHLIESNYLTPKIVGSKVRLSPLFTVMIVVIGDLIWGIAGMILFIPMLGVVKIICDAVEDLRPYGLLIGDESLSEKKMIARKKVMVEKKT